MSYHPPVPLAAPARVSVVIPCYNYGHFLPDAVDSVLTQSGVDVDVLIVDDASPDGSARVAHELADADPRVRVIAHETNKGHITTYNEGLQAVDGDYVVLLSADDLLTPGCLERAVALMERHPDVAFTYGWAQSFSEQPPVARTEVSGWSVWQGRDWIRHLCRSGRNVVTNPEVVMRGDVMRKLRGYDPELPHAADFELWLRAAQLGDVGRVNGTDQAFYRAHGGNMHLTEFSGLLLDLRERLAVFDRIVPANGQGGSAAAGLNAAARRALAREAVRLGQQAVDRGGSFGGGTAEEYCLFALRTWPGIVRTPGWAVLQKRMRRTPVPFELAAFRLYRRIRVHMWWLRERRTGL
jgi:GT2 family glycosyltransferase